MIAGKMAEQLFSGVQAGEGDGGVEKQDRVATVEVIDEVTQLTFELTDDLLECARAISADDPSAKKWSGVDYANRLFIRLRPRLYKYGTELRWYDDLRITDEKINSGDVETNMSFMQYVEDLKNNREKIRDQSIVNDGDIALHQPAFEYLGKLLEEYVGRDRLIEVFKRRLETTDSLYPIRIVRYSGGVATANSTNREQVTG